MMTFQVTLVGSDGLIVGSERRQVYYTTRTDISSGAIQMTTARKFIQNDEKNVICMLAGGPTAEATARAIATKCKPSDHLDEVSWKNSLINAVQNSQIVRKATDEITVVRTDISDYALVVVCSPSSPQPSITCVRDRLCTGLTTPARFLLCHLYRKSPIARLKKLALAALFYAEKEHPTLIGGGYDIMMLNKKGNVSWIQGDSIPEPKGFIDAAWKIITGKSI